MPPDEAVVVTGGAGYVGSVLVRALRAQGIGVVVLDDLSRGHAAAIPPDVPWVRGSVASPDAVRAAFARAGRPRAVVHLAAFAYVGESMRHPERYFSNNVAATIALCNAMLQHGVDCIVLASSCAVYGRPDQVPVPEQAPLRPVSAYGASKRACEDVVAWYAAAHGWRHAVLRLFNVAGAAWGAGEHHDPEPHLVPVAIRAACGQGPPVRIFGSAYRTADGTAVRDYVHVADVARAHLAVLDWLRHDGGLVVNIGSGTGTTVRQVLEAVQRACGTPVPYSLADRRPGDPPAVVADVRRAREALGWHPVQSRIDDIVTDALNHARRLADGDAPGR